MPITCLENSTERVWVYLAILLKLNIFISRYLYLVVHNRSLYNVNCAGKNHCLLMALKMAIKIEIYQFYESLIFKLIKLLTVWKCLL